MSGSLLVHEVVSASVHSQRAGDSIRWVTLVATARDRQTMKVTLFLDKSIPGAQPLPLRFEDTRHVDPQFNAEDV